VRAHSTDALQKNRTQHRQTMPAPTTIAAPEVGALVIFLLSVAGVVILVLVPVKLRVPVRWCSKQRGSGSMSKPGSVAVRIPHWIAPPLGVLLMLAAGVLDGRGLLAGIKGKRWAALLTLGSGAPLARLCSPTALTTRPSQTTPNARRTPPLSSPHPPPTHQVTNTSSRTPSSSCSCHSRTWRSRSTRRARSRGWR